uniref:Uncharacterized protein n=1 Tax=Anopheles dirus TaxID=7168 RepID=A0A182NXW9_9DIPT
MLDSYTRFATQLSLEQIFVPFSLVQFKFTLTYI